MFSCFGLDVMAKMVPIIEQFTSEIYEPGYSDLTITAEINDEELQFAVYKLNLEGTGKIVPEFSVYDTKTKKIVALYTVAYVLKLRDKVDKDWKQKIGPGIQRLLMKTIQLQK